ncbi:MAG: LacI family DNA-binding transcriptional regulator [Sphaerochaetaceae bacterium]|jgi:LacI family transcriptional regulator
MATIKDVAKKAGVSIATVSRVINEVPNVKPIYIAKVDAAIKSLNYQPNILAQSMKSHKQMVIGLIVPDFSSPFFGKVIKAIEKEFSSKYLVLFVDTYDDPEIERNGIQYMKSRGANVILITSTGKNEDSLRSLKDSGLSVIFFDRRPKENDQFPVVLQDKRDGTRKVLELFTNMGHERIAIITGPSYLTSNEDRKLGVEDFLENRDYYCDKIHCYFGTFSEEYGYQMAEKLLQKEESPTAILTGSSIIAAGILLFCKEHDIRVPNDLSLVSFGDIASGQLIDPRLSYIDDEHSVISRLLISLIQESFQKKLAPKEISISAHIIQNKSVFARKS